MIGVTNINPLTINFYVGMKTANLLTVILSLRIISSLSVSRFRGNFDFTKNIPWQTITPNH